MDMIDYDIQRCGIHDQCKRDHDELSRLRQRAKDAERYRLAVDEDIDTVELRIWVGGENGRWEYPRTKYEADAAIDAAMEDGVAAEMEDNYG